MSSTLASRNSEVERLFRAGFTYQRIGDKYGITKERVRGILTSRGVGRKEGGAHIRSLRKKAAIHARREQKCLDSNGCDLRTYSNIRAAHPRVEFRFRRQRQNARDRGIPFELNFYQWWRIWEQSGHYEDYGRGYGKWCMARDGDTGPYAIGNVKIIPAVINNIEYQEHKNGKRYHESRARVLDSIMDAV